MAFVGEHAINLRTGSPPRDLFQGNAQRLSSSGCLTTYDITMQDIDCLNLFYSLKITNYYINVKRSIILISKEPRKNKGFRYAMAEARWRS